MAKRKIKTKTINMIRTIAKVWSAIMIVSVGLFGLAHLFGPEEVDTLPMTLVEGVALMFFPVGVLVGMAISWKWEKEGAIVTIISLIIFFLLIVFPRGVAFRMLPTIFIIPGPSLLFLYSSLSEKSKRKKK